MDCQVDEKVSIVWIRDLKAFFATETVWAVIVKMSIVVFLSWLSYMVAKRILIRLLLSLSAKSKNTFDDLLIKHKVFRNGAYMVPAVVVYYFLEWFPSFTKPGHKIVYIYILANVIVILDKLLSCGLDIYQTYPISRRKPLKGYFQLIKILLYILGGILIFSLILDKSPWGLLSGIGALTAVLLLVFKDTILSLVAGMQIASNDLLRRGDWIEMPSMGADGDVIEVALHTVKVQNFDKTIVAIPTHKFLDNSFRNWRGMDESGGRRIKRSLLIDQSSVRFCDQAMLEKFQQIDILKDYMTKKEEEIAEHNLRTKASPESPLNGRRLTNLGTFRAYVQEYLSRHPLIHQASMTQLVRQLKPEADHGLPLEIYCFTRTTNWNEYEAIQADIFDHLLAALPEFGLRAYQRNALSDTRVKG